MNLDDYVSPSPSISESCSPSMSWSVSPSHEIPPEHLELYERIKEAEVSMDKSLIISQNLMEKMKRLVDKIVVDVVFV